MYCGAPTKCKAILTKAIGTVVICSRNVSFCSQHAETQNENRKQSKLSLENVNHCLVLSFQCNTFVVHA